MTKSRSPCVRPILANSARLGRAFFHTRVGTPRMPTVSNSNFCPGAHNSASASGKVITGHAGFTALSLDCAKAASATSLSLDHVAGLETCNAQQSTQIPNHRPDVAFRNDRICTRLMFEFRVCYNCPKRWFVATANSIYHVRILMRQGRKKAPPSCRKAGQFSHGEVRISD